MVVNIIMVATNKVPTTADRCGANNVESNGPEGTVAVVPSMMNPNDRARKYEAGAQRIADSTNRDSNGEQARRIEQRRVILEDGTLPHEIRRKAHERKCQLEREGDDDE